MKKKLLLFAAAVALLWGSATAQNEEVVTQKVQKTETVKVVDKEQQEAETSTQLLVGFSMPQAGFGDGLVSGNSFSNWGLVDEKMSGGGAGRGLFAGLKINHNWENSAGFGIFMLLDFYYHDLNQSLQSHFEQAEKDGKKNYDSYTLKTPKYYIGGWAMGPSFRHNFGRNFAIIADAGLSMSGVVISALKSEAESSGSGYKMSSTSEFKYDGQLAFGYRVDFGIMIARSIGFEVGFSDISVFRIKSMSKVNHSEHSFTNMGGTVDNKYTTENFYLTKVRPKMLTLSIFLAF